MPGNNGNNSNPFGGFRDAYDLNQMHNILLNNHFNNTGLSQPDPLSIRDQGNLDALRGNLNPRFPRLGPGWQQ